MLLLILLLLLLLPRDFNIPKTLSIKTYYEYELQIMQLVEVKCAISFLSGQVYYFHLTDYKNCLETKI